MGCRIDRIGFYLPEKTVATPEIIEEFGWGKAKKLSKYTGVELRHLAADGETALDLAEKACKNILDDELRDSIDQIIYCTQTPDYYLPTTACLLQKRLDLHTTIGALDIVQGCSGFVLGLSLAKGLIAAGIRKTVLLVNADTLNKLVNPLDQANRIIFGDAATATIIRYSKEECIHTFDYGTDGTGAKHLLTPNGGMRHRYDPQAELKKDESGNQYTDNNIYMNGPEIFNFTIQAVPVLVENVLKANNMTVEDLDGVVFHQANKFILEYLRKLVHVPEEKFHNNLSVTGNTSSATIPLGLAERLESGKFKAGDKVLLAGFGVGFSWAGVIITI